MRASEIMTSPAVSVTGDTSVSEAIVLLTENGFSAVPVVDSENQVVGIFTESDALRGGTKDETGAPRRVGSTMTTPVEVVTPGTEVHEIARRMLTDRLRCVPVVEDGVLVGVVGRRNLLRPLVRHDDAVAAHVRALLADYAGHRNRWTVTVAGGVVTIEGEIADDAERGLLDALTKTVPGVSHTEFGTGRRVNS